MQAPLTYSPYLPDNYVDEAEQHSRDCRAREAQIAAEVKSRGLIELECDYFGTCSYYWCPKTRAMFKTENRASKYAPPGPLLVPSNDGHILRLNGLMADEPAPYR